MKTLASGLVLLVFSCYGAPPHRPKHSVDLQNAQNKPLVEVIVQWQIPVGAATAEKIDQVGGTVVNEFQALDSGVYRVPGAALATLENDPAVRYISAERHVHHKLDLAADAINAPFAWRSGYTGAGIGIAIIDSGITPDADLGTGPSSNVVYTQDFTPNALLPDGEQASPMQGYGQDWFGHGEHIAGIIASNGRASSGPLASRTFIGIAPRASLLDLKVLDETGEGTDAAVMAAINQAILLKNKYNVRVINLSLGRPVYESYTLDPLCQAVEAAWKAGIVVVVAAGNDGRDDSIGNDGYGTITAPGNDPYVITVGAMKAMDTPTRTDDLIASYSSKGPTAVDHIVKPDILAPGNLMVSLLAPNGLYPAANPQNASAALLLLAFGTRVFSGSGHRRCSDVLPSFGSPDFWNKQCSRFSSVVEFYRSGHGRNSTL